MEDKTKTKQKNILVTGGAGYIGSHTCVRLIESGYSVFVIDNFYNSEPNALVGVKKITGADIVSEDFNLCDKEKVVAFFNKYSIDAVIHFAAYKAVGESVEEPLKYYENNLVSLLNILEAMKATNTKKFVFSSSCTVYGEPKTLPVTEQTKVVQANSPYGNTKQISEEIISDFISANPDSNAISLRYFNPIGAHSSSEIGELPKGEPNCLVPYITQTAAGIRESLSVFGNDYDTPDGTCIRDYIHIEDLADAHMSALEKLFETKDGSHDYYNIGTGKGYSVMEVINTFEEVTGEKINYKICPRRSGDVEKVFADVTKANDELGWRATRSLGEMLKSAWEWEKKYREK